MNKYIEIARIQFKAQMAYRFDVAMTVLFTVTKILFAYILWGAIFAQNEVVAGFTFPMMLSYYIISAFLSQIEMSDSVSSDVSERIRGGTFSKHMVIPASVNGYFIAQTLGRMAFHLLFVMMGTILWILLFGVDFVITSNILTILSAVVIILLGLLFMVQLNFFLGMLAFMFQDIGFFLIIKSNIATFVTGGLIPLMLLPEGIVSVMKFLPFYYVTYLPSMLFIGRNEQEAVTGIIMLSIWLFVFVLLNKIAYQKMRIIYDGVGI